MRARCSNPNDNSYKWYAEKGIKVCDRWLNSFEDFVDDMGEKPSIKHSIERIDNNGNYSPQNCRWATRVEQANNVSNNHILIYKGVSLNLNQWATQMGMGHTTLRARIRLGWNVEKALTTPVNKY